MRHFHKKRMQTVWGNPYLVQKKKERKKQYSNSTQHENKDQRQQNSMILKMAMTPPHPNDAYTRKDTLSSTANQTISS